MLLDEEDEVHDAVGEIGFGGGAEFAELGLQGEPADFEGGQIGGILGRRGEIRVGGLGAGVKTFAGGVEGGHEAAIAFGVGDAAKKRIGAENKVGGLDGLSGGSVLRIEGSDLLEILLGGAVAAEKESGFTGAGEGERIFRIDLKNTLVSVESVAGIVDGGEELGGLEEVGRPGGLRLHETEDFGLRHGKALCLVRKSMSSRRAERRLASGLEGQTP